MYKTTVIMLPLLLALPAQAQAPTKSSPPLKPASTATKPSATVKATPVDSKPATADDKPAPAAKPSIQDAAMQKLRKGEALTAEEKARCNAAHEEYYQRLAAKYDHCSNTEFPEPDRTDFFVNCIRMSLIDFSTHGGWAFSSDLKDVVYDGLKKKIEESHDPFVMFCAIFPALDADDEKSAVDYFNKLRAADVFLAKKVIEWAEGGYYNDTNVFISFAKACGATNIQLKAPAAKDDR